METHSDDGDLVDGQVHAVDPRGDHVGDAIAPERCNLPLTGTGVVHGLITDLAVFDFEGGLTLTELAPGVTVEEVREKTGAAFRVAENLLTMD